MKRLALALAAALLGVSVAWSLQDSKDPPKKDAEKKDTPTKAPVVRQPAKLTPVQEEYQALQAEVRQAQAPALAAFRAAEEEEARDRAIEEYYKKGEPFAPRFIEFAKKNDKDPMAFTALVNVVSMMGDQPAVQTAIDMLLKDYESRWAQATQTVSRGRGPGPEKLIRAVVAKSTDDKTQAAANFSLGLLLIARSEKAYEKQPAQADKLSAEAEKHFALVAEQYADADPASSTRAKGELFKLRNLAIGKVVPEIEGEDTDGKKFKLSDYRGKVVVIDFWGHW